MRMSPTLPLQQALISDPAVIKDLISEDGGSCVSAPGRLNGLLSQVVGQHSIILLAPTAHRQRRKLLTPPFHGERLKAYGHLIVSLAEQSMEDVLLGDVVDVRERMQAITMQVILTAVFGFDEGESFQQIARGGWPNSYRSLGIAASFLPVSATRLRELESRWKDQGY